MSLLRCFFCLLVGALACAAPVRAQAIAPLTTSTTQLAPTTLDAVLEVLQQVTFTQLDAKLSLESAQVGGGKVNLRGVKIENLRLGVKITSRGVQQLVNHFGQNVKADSPLKPVFDIIRLGLFSDIEVGFFLRELNLKTLDLDSEDLKIEGLLVAAGVENSRTPTKPSAAALDKLLAAVRSLVFNRASLHAGLEHLAAKRLDVQLEGLNLEGLRVGVSLAR